MLSFLLPLWLSIIPFCLAQQSLLGDDPPPLEEETSYPTFTFSRYWHVVGPFQIGTRGLMIGLTTKIVADAK